MKKILRVRDDSTEERRDLGLMLLLGEEFAREAGKEIAKWMAYPPPPPVEVTLPPRLPRVPRERVPRVPAVPAVPTPRDIVSRTLDRRDTAVPFKFDLIKVEGTGRLGEITVKSPSTDFNLLLEVDEKTLIDRSYSELAEISPHSQIVDAYEDAENGIYVVHVGEMRWVRSALASVYIVRGGAAITFDTLWAVWEEYI
ncbi:MAG: hypothetical protein ACETVR_03420 [Candidatus Bathyarchaeia archaeon]